MLCRSFKNRRCGAAPSFFFTALLALGGACSEGLAIGDRDAQDGPPAIRFRVQGVQALPGDVVRVPFLVNSPFPLSMAAFSIEYDTSVLDLVLPRLSDEVQRLLERLGGNNSHVEWFVNEEEGWFQFSLVLDFGGREPFTLPSGVFPVLALVFKVLDDAPRGEYPLRFTRQETAVYSGNFSDGEEPVYNSVRRPGPPFTRDTRFRRGEAEDPQLEDGLFIIGDVGVFIRGDANTDREVDIADSITVLLHLFGGGRPFDCADAADANDDGTIDISDPITMLGYLFLGVETFAIAPGVLVRDETPDDLGCTTY